LGVRQDTTKKGTTVTNKYQKSMPKTSPGAGLAVPDDVTIAMSEIADDMREGLLTFALPRGPHAAATSASISELITCRPAPTPAQEFRGRALRAKA
jgi:hypothetical protein